MGEDDKLVAILSVAQGMARNAGDVVLSYLIGMALMHAEHRHEEATQASLPATDPKSCHLPSRRKLSAGQPRRKIKVYVSKEPACAK